MVLAERGIQDIRSGRRSRAASPANGHISDGSNATDESEHSMKVGDEYQASVPDLISSEACPENVPENALLVWSPHNEISDSKLDEYVSLAKEKFGYNVEQSLGMLFWHKYDMEMAISDLSNFMPFPDEWTVEDKVLFEQAFNFHGKSFHKIRQMLPDKSVSSLVKYYYSWKKMRSRTSLMDRQVRKLSNQRDEGSDVGSEAPSENESDMDAENKDKSESAKTPCSNCGNVNSGTVTSLKGNQCQQCGQHLKGGSVRSGSGGIRTSRHNPLRSKRKPPRGMHLHYEDFITLVTGSPGEADCILKSMDSEIIGLKRQVQNNKQIIGQLKHKTLTGIDYLRPPDSASRINARWSNDELLLAVQAIRKYGRDWKAIGEVIGTKTEAHVRNYFVNYRRRYNLDDVLKEYDAENGITDDAVTEEPMDVDRNGIGANASSLPSSPSGASQAPAPPLLHPPQSPSSTPGSSNLQRSCPPPLQQASPARGTQRNLLHQPPPLICPTNTFHNGT